MLADSIDPQDSNLKATLLTNWHLTNLWETCRNFLELRLWPFYPSCASSMECTNFDALIRGGSPFSKKIQHIDCSFQSHCNKNPLGSKRMIIELDLRESGQEVLVSEAFQELCLNDAKLGWDNTCDYLAIQHMSRPLRHETAKTFKVMPARHDMTGVFLVLVRLQDLEVSADKASHPGVRRDRLVCYLCTIAFNVFMILAYIGHVHSFSYCLT